MKYIYNIVYLLLFSNFSFGQDPIFTQFYNSPMLVNPSLVGTNMKMKQKFTFISKNQSWNHGIQSYYENMITLEKDLTYKMNSNNNFYLGILFLNQNSNNGILNNNYFIFNLTDKIKLSENDFLKASIQSSYKNTFVNLSNSYFQNQFDSYGFSNISDIYDPISSFSISNFDVNPGVIYEHIDNNIKYNFGFAIFNVSKPVKTLSSNFTYFQPVKYIFNGSLNYNFQSNNSLFLSGYYQFNQLKNLFTLGGTYGFDLNNASNIIYLGFWNRFGYSISPNFGIKHKNVHFNLTYDIPTKNKIYNVYKTSIFETSLVVDFGK